MAFVIMIVIFAFSVYLVLSKEAEEERKGVASMTNAIGTRLLVSCNIVEEHATEEMTTEEQTTEQLTTEQVIVTTEATTEEITTEVTTEEEITYEETYIYDGSYDTYEYSDYDYGYEEESYGEEPDDSYVEPEEYVEENDEDPGDTNGMRYYGTMDTTAYEWTERTCADGRYPELGYTAACNDPALWNHWVYIEGVGERYIHDHGDPEVMGNTTVDIYMGDVDTCYQYGRQTCDIYIID